MTNLYSAARPVNTFAGVTLPTYFLSLTAVAPVILSWLLFTVLQPSEGEEYEINPRPRRDCGGHHFALLVFVASLRVEGRRKAVDRLAGILVTSAFLVALTPLVSLIFTVVTNGVVRFDADFFTLSMRNVVGEGGGAAHAMVGTLIMTLAASAISVPIGLLTSIYLVEYGAGKRLTKWITFFVDVMTGIPSIVAGLFAYSLSSKFCWDREHAWESRDRPRSRF